MVRHNIKITRMSLDEHPIPRYMSAAETAEMLHVSVHTLYLWLKLPDPPPSHQIMPKGRRLFIASEVHEWVLARSRCIDTAAGEVA